MAFCRKRLQHSFFLAASIVALPLLAEDWPSIRGPHFDGSIAAEGELAEGPLTLRVAWKRPAGSGYSGIVASDDQLFSAMADSKTGKEYVVAMSAESGKTVWRTETGPIMKGENGSFDGPVATPAVDQRHVYHLSPQGRLAAYDRTSGSVVWSKHLKNDFGAEPNFYGFGASPIVVDDVLVLNVGAPASALMGFDAVTGNVKWKAGEDGASFQTPIVTELDGEKTILATGNTKLMAIRPSDGSLLWSQTHGGAEGFPAMAVVPVPLPNGGVFIADQKNQSTGLDLGKSGAAERWSGRDLRNSYCVPVMAGGLLCSYSSRILVAVDPLTGERAWRSRSPGDGFLASLSGRLVVATLKGSLHIGDVSEDGFDEVAAIKVFDSGTEGSDGLLWSLPSLSGNRVYLRSLGAIACVEVQSGRESQIVRAGTSVESKGFASFVQTVADASDKQSAIDSYLASKDSPIIEDGIVHFVLQGDYSDVAVASELFGVRQERPMTRIEGTDLFYFGTAVDGPTRASYVYYADYQPISDPRNTKTFVSTLLTGEMEPMFIGPESTMTFSWFDVGSAASTDALDVDRKGELAGTMESFDIESRMLGDSVPIDVYLPPGYKTSKDRYPVVFVHDGKVAMEQGHQALIVDSLIQSRAIRPTVVIFIGRRFYPLQGADGYVEMFVGELIPRVTETYRVSESRKDRASLGGGFGATLGLMGTLPASEQVSRMGCHSPFAFELLHPVFTMLSKLPNQRCDILIQWGRYEFRNPAENWNMATQAETLADILRSGQHRVTAEQVPVGTDWASWRTQSETMWKFLVGPTEP
ncbi:MAG: PQQ-binding-like beta-propeller repeat protein [Planctomycetota bacterium]